VRRKRRRRPTNSRAAVGQTGTLGDRKERPEWKPTKAAARRPASTASVAANGTRPTVGCGRRGRPRRYPLTCALHGDAAEHLGPAAAAVGGGGKGIPTLPAGGHPPTGGGTRCYPPIGGAGAPSPPPPPVTPDADAPRAYGPSKRALDGVPTAMTR